MCLDYTKSKRTKVYKEIMEQAKKRGWIKVWKVCVYKKTGWHSRYRQGWKKGIKKADGLNNIFNHAGWYCFLSEKAAKKYQRFTATHLKQCMVKPEWLIQLGGYNGCGLAGRFTYLAFPNWNKGKMTVKEFKEMCKKSKGK